MAYDFKKLEEKINAAAERFKNETASLRTGRANPALVQDLKIEAYGETNSLKNLASISTEDAKTISVQPWDKSLLEAIEKGINNSALGLRASAAKDKVRVVLPAITQERRQALLKLLKEKLEETRVSLRKDTLVSSSFSFRSFNKACLRSWVIAGKTTRTLSFAALARSPSAELLIPFSIASRSDLSQGWTEMVFASSVEMDARFFREFVSP